MAQDEAEAVRWFRLAAEQGHVTAQAMLGGMYSIGEGVTQDEAEAVRWFRLAAEQGDATAQTALGAMYFAGSGVVARDDAEAVRLFRLAAEQGSDGDQSLMLLLAADYDQIRVVAQTVLGLMYSSGLRVARDDAEAVRWYRLAAEQGNATAQTALGDMYSSGRGVAQDDAEAVRWYRLAAEQGDADAQYNLGVRYANGRGVAEDDAEAVRWYRLAAEQGNATAQYNLGFMYANGRGVAEDDAEAVRWYRLAAEQGNATAQSNLDALYAAGRAVPDTTLHGLQLSEGPPEPGFTFSAMAGRLPNGNVTLTPAFEPGTTTYHAEVSQPLLTIRARAAVSVDITATGVTADGRALPVVNQSRLNDVNGHGNFLSVTFSELALGENRIQIADCTIVVTRSARD